MSIAAFPAEAAFLPALAQAWLAAPGDSSEGVIILPNRRAARALAGAFLQANQGRPLMLPRIMALGSIDEAGLSLTASLELPPAIAPVQRQAILARLILARQGAQGAPRKLHSAWTLAADLAALLDEAAGAEIKLPEALRNVVAADLATHWQTTLEFLEIVTATWPAILQGMNMLDPAERLRRLVDAQNAAWQASPPTHRLWLVTHDATPALGRLAKTVAGLAQGALVLPGYDAAMSDAAWEALQEGHAQMGTARLLAALGVRREEVQIWPAPPSRVPPARVAVLSKALLPAAALGAWRHATAGQAAGLRRLSARGEQEEATAIAMAMRDALENAGQSVALITPDRALAARVSAALRRFGIVADDSAGEALAETPPAVFLRLLAQAVASEFAPLPLLAVLKHPLCAVGLAVEQCREQARQLERAALRGTRPAPGFAGIKFRLQESGKPADRDFVDRLEHRLQPLAGPAMMVNPADGLRQLIAAGETMAASATVEGSLRLWSGEAGIALSDALGEAMAVLADLPDMAASDLGLLLQAVLAGHVVRRPRTKDGHPRVAVWGVQEASLQTVDVAILGGLVEGVWPAVADPGPWLSRPMRKAALLPAPEQMTSLAAHDFFSLCCRCPQIIFATPVRRERAPVVPARWITRLEALLAGAGEALQTHDAEYWVEQIDLPQSRPQIFAPSPRPPAASRLKSLSISDIATLIADPYAIYARKILGINELNALDEESDAGLFGNIVHAGLERFYSQDPDFFAPNAVGGLALALHTAMRAHRPRAALQHWWEARLERIAGWIVQAERARQQKWGAPAARKVETPAILDVAGGFTLRGRADRIERRQDGAVFIMDYKTGTPPKDKDVKAGNAPQLPLEAMMAEAGAFGPEFLGAVKEIQFWKLSGRHVEGEEKALLDKNGELRAVIDQARDMLPALFAKFADPKTAFLAAPHPDRKTYKDVFKGISRRAEWGGERDDDDDSA